MAGTDHTHDADSEGTLRDILADLVSTQAESSHNTPLPTFPSLQADSSWILPPYSPLPPRAPSTSTRLPPSPMPRTSSASRPAKQQIAASTPQAGSSTAADPNSQSGPFTTPSRSIFSSGPPTASVSANTALASLSSAGPSSTSRPLAALTATNANSNKPSITRSCETSPRGPVPGRETIQIPEKDVDDPSSTLYESSHKNTAMAISKLLGEDGRNPYSVSRDLPYLRALANANGQNDASTMPGHLLQRGLIEGKHSDITIHAFGSSYRLHRLMLDRAPYFSSALSGAWAESTASEMTLHPEEVDSNITKTAFELALKRIYGCQMPLDEEAEAVGLFATGCWLDMPNLVESSVEILLRQMEPGNLDTLVKLVTSNYYGRSGDRILASAKAMLCREGWEMPYEYWDNIPSEIIREVVGSDAFFVPGEWERWYLALRLLNRRLKLSAIKAGLVSKAGRCLQPKPHTIGFFALRFDTYRRDQMLAGRGNGDGEEAWIGLYTSSEVAPLLVLLDEGIHYVHLRFEQLQRIRQQKDRFGVPVIPEKVISDALWMSMELRQRVLNAHESEMELGLSQIAPPCESDVGSDSDTEPNNVKGKQPESHLRPAQETKSGSWDGNGKPRKFWIPTCDSSSMIGGTSEACLNMDLSNNSARWAAHMSRLSASLEPSDARWATDFTINGSATGGNGSGRGNIAPVATSDGPETSGTNRQQGFDRAASPPCFSHYPPFRFSAAFPDPRTLKEKKRVYSQTVWYAGSMWNLYIQRVITSKNQQLGIYLHRAKDKDPSDDPLALYSSATVDDRIGQLEREMLMRRNNHRHHQSWRSSNTTVGGAELEVDDGSFENLAVADNSGQINVSQPSAVGDHLEASFADPQSGMSRRLPTHLARAQKTSQTPENTGNGSGNSNNNSNAVPPISSSNHTASTRHHLQSSSAHRTPLPVNHDYISDSDHDDPEDFSATVTGAAHGQANIPAGDSDTEGEPSTFISSQQRHKNTHNHSPSSRQHQKDEHHRKHHKHPRRLPATHTSSLSMPTLPPYTDARPTIKTYFKIYSPSRAGRLLSVYESAPDKFNFSQSWGWKSSSLGVLDDGLGYGGSTLPIATSNMNASAPNISATATGPSGTVADLGSSEAKLRYMVVIGNV